MKRWVAIGLASVVIATASILVYRLLAKRAQQNRETTYHAVLRAYSTVLTPGMKRAAVEKYLSSKGDTFSQIWNVERNYGTADDIVKIGQEDGPWYCSRENIYIAFLFISAEDPRLQQVTDSDTLRGVTIWPHSEDCL